MWGGGISLAYAVQVAVTLAVVGGLAWLWRSNYDLMLLAPAIAILAADRMQRGFHPWQKSLLAALWLMPILARPVAQATLIPLAVPAMLGGLCVAAAARNDAAGTKTLWRFAIRPLK